jgi:transposase
MDARQERGLAIAATQRLVKRGGVWLVPSQSNNGKYTVSLSAEGDYCSCPDHEVNGKRCKHIFAVEFVIKRETNVQGETTITGGFRITYSQDWAAYNMAQTTEKEQFVKLFRELCANIPNPPQANGRPRLPLSDMLFAAGFKVYTGLSGRRFMSDMRKAHADGVAATLPCYNSIFNVLEPEEVTPIIREMITRSALPLKAIETDFAIDSTGFTSTQLVGSWQSEKYGAKRHRVEHDWLKVHAMVGTKSNAVVAIEIGGRNSADTKYFAPLLETTTEHFNPQRVLGDKAYSTHANIALAERKGVAPVIPFKTYAVGTTDNETWNKLFHFFSFHREQFLRVYHQRSDAESTFSAIKRKFGDFVRSKTPVAQVNELLLKFVAHNIVCVIHAMQELGINPVS